MYSEIGMISESPITTGFTVLIIAAVHLYVLKTARGIERSEQPDGFESVVIKKFRDNAALSKDFCAFVARAAKEAIAMRGVFHMAVAGGQCLDSLRGLVDYKDSIELSKMVLTFVEHQCVDPYGEEAILTQCQTKFAADAGIKNIVVPSPTPEKDGDGTREATFYAKAMRDAGIPHKSGYPVFDLVVLGLGPEGHVGACYPWRAGVRTFDMAAVTPTRKSGEPATVTFTLETINVAHEVAIVAVDGAKDVARQKPNSPVNLRSILSALSKSPIFFVNEETAGHV